MELILYLIMGGIIGWFAGLLLRKDVPGGILGNVIAGILGSWIGGQLLGHFGPTIFDIAFFPALIGAVIFVFLLGLMTKVMKK
ncbi:GlsB/YeaQ/YmgE family stress response membrane protein [Litchfieldia alkalitelluris]|uniref:GlsB/YeaQ/YmgE family stress response membrane protein n=1 Tax=Litchfieldia alkalitelluris TaxID=304268 RepID=UPI001115F800|nr:GlsB/YeaQ/YmgE family stress response membrane protein [Litchfieldia alkalitelluris]